MPIGGEETARGTAGLFGARSLVRALALAAAVGSASAAETPGNVDLQLALGGGSPGAPGAMLGVGLAVREDGVNRIGLFGRVGFGYARTIEFADPAVADGTAKLRAYSLHLDATFARRIERFEPFVGIGLATASAGGTFDYFCHASGGEACAGHYLQNAQGQFDGSWSSGPSVSGGARYAFTDQLLLEGEIRYQHEGRSRFTQLPVSTIVGGWSGLVSLVWRPRGSPFWALQAPRRATPPPMPPVVVAAPAPPAPPATPPAPPAAAPSPPAAASAVADACPVDALPVLLVRSARRYRCYPDPVRGGHYCDASSGAVDFVDVAHCEASCRGADVDCPAGAGAVGAACRRCVQGCAEPRAIPCPGTAGWTKDGPVCVLPAGRFGLDAERAVPAACP